MLIHILSYNVIHRWILFTFMYYCSTITTCLMLSLQSSGNQVLTSSGSLLSLCIVQVICIVLIPLVITKDIQQDYSNVTAKESVITADNEIYTNNSSDYTVYNTSGLITWHDDSFPTSSHHIEPADPCKAGR